MFELGTRLAIAAAACAAAYGGNSMGFVFQTAALFAAYSILLFQLESRGFRTAAVSMVAACVDAGTLALVLGRLGLLSSFGFAVLAPAAFAANRHGANAQIMGPMSAAALMCSHIFFASGGLDRNVYIQIASVLAIGLALNSRRVIVKVAEPVLPSSETLQREEDQDVLRLRESFRRLKEHFQEVTRRSQRDRTAVSIIEAIQKEGADPIEALAGAIAAQTSAEGAILYSPAQFERRLVVCGTGGDVPAKLATGSLEIDLRQPLRQIEEELVAAARDTLGARSRVHTFTSVLRSKGRVRGAICLVHEDPYRLNEAGEILEEVGPIVASLLHNGLEKRSTAARIAVAELLYEFASRIGGAKTASTLASRCIHELIDLLRLDSVGVFRIDGSNTITLAKRGKSTSFLETMSFATGSGMEGWIALGSPELLIPDVHTDSRCSSAASLKHRIGSMALIPIRFSEVPYGYLVACTDRVGGIDTEQIDLLRSLTGELTTAIARLEGLGDESSGIATPAELQEAAADCDSGALVHLEPIRRSQVIESIGKPAFEAAMREFARKLRLHLPARALVAKRDEGDMVVLLRNVTMDFARSWANEAAALASFIGVRVLESGSRVPLPMRAKVAPIGKQNGLISEPIAS